MAIPIIYAFYCRFDKSFQSLTCHECRYLEYQGFDVRYTQNVTDIDDDILRKAKEVGEDWRQLGDRWTAHFIRDNREMNVRPPDYFPRATETISAMIEVVAQLLENGVAYEANGNVYFDVDAWDEYGKLSRLSYEEMLPIANERGNIPDDPNKTDPMDFVLWQAQKEGEPAWDSPWGPGRPGWHIECSTMATRTLGETIDVHGGGSDLLFPHHESEIAQAEAATGRRPFARFWVEVAMVRHEGEKMSKSLGNLVMVRDLLETYSPDGLRLYLASHHYRDSWEHHPADLDAAEVRASILRQAVTATGGDGPALDATAEQAEFEQWMDDDLNTPMALRVLERLAARIRELAARGDNVASAQRALRRMGTVFGLRLDADGPEARVIEGWNRHLAKFQE